MRSNYSCMKAGSLVPDFALRAHDGRCVRLSEEVTKGPVVLFFYPRAMTPGCTKESCHFRDLAKEFDEAGAQVLGVSGDPMDRQQQFTAQHAFGFPLLCDTEHSVAKAYGVKRPGPLYNRRMTFVIDEDRRLIAKFHSELNMERHADEALRVVQATPPRARIVLGSATVEGTTTAATRRETVDQ